MQNTNSLRLPQNITLRLPRWADFKANGLLIIVALLMPGVAACATPKYEDKKPSKTMYEYAVKFICGEPDVPVVAPGHYYTAINVHNPISDTVKFRKKVAVALPGEKAGPVSRFYDAALKYDEAMEIDCPDILKHADVEEGFLKGFVVIQSPSELDVVAVYTTAEWQVESLHTERVPYRIVGEPAKIKVPDPELAHCPPGGRGDPVGNEGCCCNAPRVGNPMSNQDWWPDCSPGLVCAGNLPDPQNGIPTSLYSVCTSRIVPGVNPQIHYSQPAYCGRR